jgi:hypothetical protein
MIYLAIIPIGFFIGATLGTAYKRKKKAYHIKFIDSDQMDKFFSKENIKIEKSTYCSVCGVLIRRNNIGMLTERDGKKFYVCKKSHCLKFNRLTN